MSSLSRTSLRRLFLVVLATLTALPFGTSAVHAAPSSTAWVTGSEHDVQVRIGAGALGVEDGLLVIRDGAGKVLDGFRLSYIAPDNRTYPIDATIKGLTATLVPSVDPARSTTSSPASLAATKWTPGKKNAVAPGTTGPNVTTPGANSPGGTSGGSTTPRVVDPSCDPSTKAQRQQQAVSLLSGEMSLASGLGATIGGALGLIIGILGGGVLALISVPLGSLIGVGIGVGIVAATGGFTRYFKVMNGKDC